MTKLCIKKFEQGNKKPLTTVSIPLAVIKLVKSLIPKKAKEELQKEGIDINEIIKLSESPDFTGTVLEVDNHEKNDTVVWDAHAFCYGAIADHDRLAETKFRTFGTVIKGLLAPAAVILMRREYSGAFHFLEATEEEFQNKESRKFYSNSSSLPNSPLRKGWKKIMEQFDYKQTHVVLEKLITKTEKENK